MKYECAHCGAKSYSPLMKGRAGGMSSRGVACPECGGRCVNGKLNLIVNSIISGIAFIMIIVTYFTYETKMQIVYFAVIPLVLSLIINFVFNMFFGKLIEAIKRD